MVRLLGIVGLLGFLLWVYCIFDVIAADESLVRNLPKMLWLIIVIITSAVGAVAWLARGRPENLSFQPGSLTTGRRGGPWALRTDPTSRREPTIRPASWRPGNRTSGGASGTSVAAKRAATPRSLPRQRAVVRVRGGPPRPRYPEHACS